MFSIIVPVYNAEAYVNICIDSILRAGKIANEKLEVIIIDDASTDNTPKMLKKYASEKQVRIIRNNNGGGVSCSRNLGLNLATQDWIWLIDADDFIDEVSIKNLNFPHL